MRNTTRELNRHTGTDESSTDPRRILPFMKTRMRGGVIGIVALTVVLATGAAVTTVRLLDNGHGGDGAAAMNTSTSAVAASTGAANSASGGVPQLASTPRVAVMPTSATGSASGASRARNSSAPSKSPSTQASVSATPTTSTAATGSATCQHPQYVTSDPTGMWNLAPYFVANDMWGISGYSVSQTIYACSYSDWYVVATMNNDSGNGAVKTYPNSHRDFDSAPEISSFTSITSTFAETSPETGIYEDAYDIWLNGIASSGSTEVMIWTQNNGQTPAGSVLGL